MIELTVVTPVRDEVAGIAALVGDLFAQRHPPAQVIIADTGSTDGTIEVLAKLEQRYPALSLIRLGSGFPGAGRNAGLHAATTDWVAFVDAGMRVGPGWLEALAAPLADQQVDLVLGGLEPVVGSRAQRASALAYVPARRPTPTGGRWRGFCLPSSLVRRGLALEVGGFPEALRSGEDLRFFERLRDRARIAYAPEAVVYWGHASSPEAVWRRFRTYAEHSFRADLMSDWFDVVARRYALAIALGGPFSPSLMGALLLARAVVMQHRKPEFVDPGLVGRIRQVVEVAGYLGIIDLATFSAWVRWRAAGKPLLRQDSSLGQAGA